MIDAYAPSMGNKLVGTYSYNFHIVRRTYTYKISTYRGHTVFADVLLLLIDFLLPVIINASSVCNLHKVS